MTDLDRALGIEAPPPSPEEEAARAQDALLRFRRCTYNDEGLEAIPPPVPLIDRWLAVDSLAWLYGARGHMKSLVALDMAACISRGLSWHGYATKQSTVLYCVLEGASGLAARVRTWRSYHEIDTTGIAFFVPRPPLQVLRDARTLGDHAADLGAGLIIIDTQNRGTVGLDENSNVDMGRMIEALDGIREETGACILTVHHAAIGGNRPRGHGSIDGAATTMVRVAKDGRVVKIENAKQRDSEATASLIMNVTDHEGGILLRPANGHMAQSDSEAVIRRALHDLVISKGKVTHGDLKRASISLGLTEGAFNYWLRVLRESGTVELHNGAYTLSNPAQGRLDDL